MSRRASSPCSVLALALTIAMLLACSRPAPAASLDPNADVVLHYPVAGGGEIAFTVRPRYATGSPIAFQLDIRAGSVEVGAASTKRVQVTWDAKDSDGKDVPAETYSLSLDFIIGADTQRYGTVIEVRAP